MVAVILGWIAAKLGFVLMFVAAALLGPALPLAFERPCVRCPGGGLFIRPWTRWVLFNPRAHVRADWLMRDGPVRRSEDGSVDNAASPPHWKAGWETSYGCGLGARGPSTLLIASSMMLSAQ